MKYKEPTWTSLVMEVLKSADDFVSREMLFERIPGINYNQLDAALFSLRKYRAVDVVINPDGTGWWFALPDEGDTRTYHVVERKPETKPRKQRKKKVMLHYKGKDYPLK